MSLHLFLKIKLLGEEYFQVRNEYAEETKKVEMLFFFFGRRIEVFPETHRRPRTENCLLSGFYKSNTTTIKTCFTEHLNS